MLNNGYDTLYSYNSLMSGEEMMTHEQSGVMLHSPYVTHGQGAEDSLHGIYSDTNAYTHTMAQILPRILEEVDEAYITLYTIFMTDPKWYYKKSIFDVKILGMAMAGGTTASYYEHLAMEYNYSPVASSMINRMLIRNGILYTV